MIVVFIVMALPAAAEGLDIGGLDRVAAAQGFDASGFIAGIASGESLAALIDPGAFLGMLKRSAMKSLSTLATALALPVLACALIQMTTGGEMGFMMNLLCALCCGKALMQVWTDAQASVRALIEGLLRLTEATTPVMASAAALTGGGFWASATVPLSNLCASLVQKLLLDWGFGLCGCAVLVALSGAVAGRYALNRLFGLLKSAARWLLGAAVFAFGGLISAQGIVSAAKDGAAVQTARMAMESVIPIIGGGVSDAAGSLMLSAGLARSAVGITGVVMIARLCLRPLVRTGCRMLALKLISAAMEPLAQGSASELIGHFGEALEILLAIGVCCAVMTAMIPVSCAVLAGGLLR